MDRSEYKYRLFLLIFATHPSIFDPPSTQFTMPTRVLTPEYLNGIFKGLKVTPQRTSLLLSIPPLSPPPLPSIPPQTKT